MKSRSTYLLWLAYITFHNVLKVDACCSTCQNFLPFYGWKIFHLCIYHILFIYPLMDTSVAPAFWLLWIMLWICEQKIKNWITTWSSNCHPKYYLKWFENLFLLKYITLAKNFQEPFNLVLGNKKILCVLFWFMYWI